MVPTFSTGLDSTLFRTQWVMGHFSSTSFFLTPHLYNPQKQVPVSPFPLALPSDHSDQHLAKNNRLGDTCSPWLAPSISALPLLSKTSNVMRRFNGNSRRQVHLCELEAPYQPWLHQPDPSLKTEKLQAAIWVTGHKSQEAILSPTGKSIKEDGWG